MATREIRPPALAAVSFDMIGRGERIRTPDLSVPNSIPALLLSGTAGTLGKNSIELRAGRVATGPTLHRSPEQLGDEELRQYFLYLANEKKIARPTATIALCGLKFFYEQTLKQHWPSLRLVSRAGFVRPPEPLCEAMGKH
ncbi:MAG: phage integrase N-terminal SAM-like domain-containing protein [Pyrinomonadaceae bacterium]|nr:phage integrase N-terminal SAM-like domain-containing protein [Pyrinomonadaceae bacterium]